jgi:hypothetical protein
MACSSGDNAQPDAGDDAGSDAASTACSQPPRAFWTWDLSVMPPADVQTPATCYGESAHAYVYVSDDVWAAGKMDQTQVDAILAAFESHTPNDPTRGSYAIDTQTFGDPPDVDGDPHIYLFYTALGVFKGQRFDGFFRDIDETNDPHSNHIEMLHMDPTGPTPSDSDYMLGIIIHEFVHLINYKYDDTEEGWLNETLAESAMALGGYETDLPTAQAYVKAMYSTPLCVSGYSDYGATFSWGAYMLDRWGTDFLRAVLQDKAHGIASVASHLPGGLTFQDAFGEYAVAAMLDQHGIGDGRYGYTSAQLGALGKETAGLVDAQSHASDSTPWGARTIRLGPTGAGTVAIDLASADFAKLRVHTVAFDPANPAAATVTAQTVDSAAVSFNVTVGATDVVDLVVAVAPSASVPDLQPAHTTFSYTATYTP